MSRLELCQVTKVLGGRAVVDRVDLRVEDGELVCLLGPSGCGKTTTLRLIAGFGEPDAGRILIDGRDVTSLGPERRPTAMVFQNYALWPHMSVLENVTFGLRARGRSRREAEQLAREVLQSVGLAALAERRPARLSGGEQQRVALARALVQRPEVLLLDEPLSNLDAQLRLRMREELADLHSRTGITMLFVTHDQDEALSLADRVVVMAAGRLEQAAAPDELYRVPVSEFVAGFVGRMSWIDGELVRGALRCRWPGWPAGLSLAELESAGDGPVRVAVRPEDLVPLEGGLPAEVVRAVPRGHFMEYVIRPPDGTPRGDPPLEGEDVLWRSYRPLDEPPAASVGWWPRRVLLYRDGRLLGVAELSTPPSRSRVTVSEGGFREAGHQGANRQGVGYPVSAPSPPARPRGEHAGNRRPDERRPDEMRSEEGWPRVAAGADGVRPVE
jgi:putative spermidine/putrescine transport system ATP-binding protein